MSTEIKNPSISSNPNVSSQNINIVDKIKTFQNIINDEKSNNRNNGSGMEQLNKTSISDYLNEFDLENAPNGSRSVALDNSFRQNNLNWKSVSIDSFSENENHDSHKHKRPVMGKAALLKKTNLEHTDSFIVHKIILNKYEDILNHYVNRMYKRRLSRMSSTSEDDCSENSTIPRYSSSATSSAGTYRSIPEFKKSCLEDNKKFYSIDNLNVDTPHENMDDSSLTCYSHFNNRTSTCCSDYDPKKFLVNALGDLANSESGSQNCTSNTGQICDDSVGTSRLSSLLSKTNSFWSLKKNKKNSRKSTTDETFKSSNVNLTDTLEQYKKELSRQHSIIFQISKALHYCKTSKEFFIGEERLEAEKILLVATITKEALINEINTIEFDTYRSIFDPRCRGEISISNVTFNMKEKIDPDQQCDYEEHFLIVLNCGRRVLSSNILKADNEVLRNERTFSFENLLSDFEINLYVYSLVINKKDYNSQDKSKCPSPKSIFKCNKESRHCKHIGGSKTSDQITFIPIGSCQIRNSELHKVQDGKLNLRLEQNSQRSSLQPSFQLQIETKFELTNRLSGFLTIGFNNAKNCVSWNRRWCILDAFILKYWNYPSEETTTNPLGQIDLRFCAEEKIMQADRSVCARTKTLSMPIRDAKGSRLYFLSADTQSDWQMWESEINFVIRSLLIWKEMKNQ